MTEARPPRTAVVRHLVRRAEALSHGQRGKRWTWASSLALVLAAAQPVAAQNLFSHTQVEGMAQELIVKVAGAKACRVEGVLVEDDIKTIIEFLLRANEPAYSAGQLKALLIVKGLNIKPGSPACKVAAEKIAEAEPTYAEMAKTMRKLGGIN